MTDHQLQLALAKALPKLVCAHTNGQHMDVLRWQDDTSDVTKREMLELMRLAELKLTDDEWVKYESKLNNTVIDANGYSDGSCHHRSLINSTWQHRAEAFLRVKGLLV